jgi:V8-like Glu-specific endopeptidase
MSRTRALGFVAAVAALACGLLITAAPALADPPAPPGTPTAVSIAGEATVGPIFRHGLAAGHGCTGSVVASPTRDLVITAAHCVSGTAAGWLFAPGYRDGQTPYGVWTVVHAYLDPAWLSNQDPQHDYAMLQLAHQTRQGRLIGVQDIAGANLLGLAPRTGATITDVAYNAGVNDRPISCTVPTYDTEHYPTFNCHGYVGGSSGSPWLTRIPGTHLNLVRGVIGGRHQGGCYEYTSYSSAFTPEIYRLLVRAAARIHPDTAPVAGSDGC